MKTVSKNNLKNNEVRIGDGHPSDKKIAFNNGAADKPYIKYNDTGEELLFSSTGQQADEVEIGRGDLAYVHIQGVASKEWIVTHNLGKIPAVAVVDSAGTVLIPDLEHLDINTTIIKSEHAFAGRAYFN